jgi:glycosyltransferase involved in cell wall biosynthesis
MAVKHAATFKQVDLCYAISVPLTVGIAAKRIKGRYGIPFVFEVGDLWPDAPIQMGFVKNRFFKQRLYALEQEIYQSATSIVALSPAIQSAIEKKIESKKISMIPNMADLNFFEKTNKDASLVLHYGVQGKFVVSYIGALGVANGLDYILDCANVSRKSSLPIQFVICGEGAIKPTLAKRIKKLELENVTLLDFTNRKGVRDLLNISDAAFISYKPVPILETGSPNKLFDALAAGKLCIINFGGWIREEIELASCGIHVDPHQPSDFAKKIKPFLSDRLMLENYQFNARTLAEKKFSRDALSMKFTELITAIIRN